MAKLLLISESKGKFQTELTKAIEEGWETVHTESFQVTGSNEYGATFSILLSKSEPEDTSMAWTGT